jgi:AcrR family transcriptional regulator
MDSTKQAIVAAGRQLLLDSGAGDFSMRKVASAAGMSLGNLQYHFKTRDDLLEGMLDWFVYEYTRDLGELGSVEIQDASGLSILIRQILEEESGEEEFPFIRALLILTNEKRMTAKLDEYFGGLYDIFRKALARIADIDEESHSAHRAASLFLPYLQGYALVRNRLDCDIHCVTQMLSEQIWTILQEERLNN